MYLGSVKWVYGLGDLHRLGEHLLTLFFLPLNKLDRNRSRHQRH
jgi:hypothetical protein